MPDAADILILSNGPGEVVTWVRPVVQAIAALESPLALRVSVVLAPCPHATGSEARIAARIPGVDRVQAAEAFWPFLLRGKTSERWDWHPRGAVVFLGGDQFFAVAIARHLGYRSVVYAEWDARWWRFVDSFGAMRPEVVRRVPRRFRHKVTVVGDLMAEAGRTRAAAEGDLVGLLVGSKPAKLVQGVPLCLAIAEQVRARRPQTRFIIPVAPTLNPAAIARYARPEHNPVLNRVGGSPATLHPGPVLQTPSGLTVELQTHFPPHETYARCRLCVTTVGANTAELGAIAVPMVAILPTQQLDAMRAWDGLPGVLANLPGVGALFAKVFNWLVLRRKRLYAWPNLWAGREIVPELVGRLRAEDVAVVVVRLLDNRDRLEGMRRDLEAVRGRPGAAAALAALVERQLAQTPRRL